MLANYFQKALASITRRKADLPSVPSPTHEEMVQELGHHFAAALGGKRGWLGSELLRLKREGSGGMDLDTPR